MDGFQAVSPAPLEFIRGSRSRPLDGHLVAGSWSDPWWLYSPEGRWAVAKRWKNPDTKVFGWGNGHGTVTDFPARNELVVTPWEDRTTAQTTRAGYAPAA